MDKEQWKKANEWEKEWWGDCTNTYDEEIKQFYYAQLMGLDQYKETHPKKRWIQFNLKGKSVLDIGGGPTSLLLKSVNFKEAIVVDPCKFPYWVKARYSDHNISLITMKAEDYSLLSNVHKTKGFDEVWIYNVLQHTDDPEKILKYLIKAGATVRLFEWIDTPTNLGHPHTLTESLLRKYFPNGEVKELKEHRCFGKAFVGVINREIKKKKRTIVIPKQKRFHLLGLAHLPTNKKESIACAYSQKILKMAKMLKSLGHYVVFYGVEGSTVECDEFVQVVNKETLSHTYGDYDCKKFTYKHDPKDFAYTTFNINAIREINKRKKKHDFLLISMGNYQKPIADAVNLGMTVEMGIGYTGIFAKYKVFESYPWMMHVYGLWKIRDGNNYDCVIPNYFEPSDFKYNNKKGDYFLYLGRVVKRKGVIVAVKTIEAINEKLIVAGQQSPNEADYVDLNSKNIEYIGFADWKKRRELFSNAKALFVPTEFIEPFGGVTIESYFSGTPVITTDWGVFSDTVIHGVTGYRCRTLDQFVWAAKNIDKIKPYNCRKFAMQNYTLDRVAQMYEEYFNMLFILWGRGWPTLNPKRTQLDWLNKWHPKNGGNRK